MNTNKQQSNIELVVKEHLCTSCGACSAACPTAAIKFIETASGNMLPSIDNKICTNCGICISVCPGIHFGRSLKEKISENPFQGTAIKSYVGKATDKEIYLNSQSGGAATVLALHLLETGQADGIITVVMEWGDPPRAKAILARTREELLEAQKSKYCPVPNLDVLRTIKDKGLTKVVLIGLPCQIHGLLNIKDVAQNIGNRVVLTIGLFCANVMVCTAIDHLITETNIKKIDGKKHIIFRDKKCCGYPGDVLIRSINGQSSVLPKKKRSILRTYYMPASCWLCFDRLNVFSDITIGDPWKLKGIDRKMGESVIVVRTSKGNKIFQGIIENGQIQVRDIQYQDIADGQKIELKKNEWNTCITEWKKMGNKLPDWVELFPRIGTKKSNVGNSCQKHLYQSLSLFKYTSREELINDVRRELRKKKIKDISLLPKKIIKTIVNTGHD